MPEYKCETCTVAYCFDDCYSLLARQEHREIDELTEQEKVEPSTEVLEQESTDAS
ncbi:hypothetical protein [Vibrio lentus]|uniref:hypothetical protein n=1 Tax=Vibrio lentus TaxID=136468 RepID=UPI000B167FFE|nr:hypothetical protein [Vibrio lentus]